MTVQQKNSTKLDEKYSTKDYRLKFKLFEQNNTNFLIQIIKFNKILPIKINLTKCNIDKKYSTSFKNFVTKNKISREKNIRQKISAQKLLDHYLFNKKYSIKNFRQQMLKKFDKTYLTIQQKIFDQEKFDQKLLKFDQTFWTS